jgi:diaminopimelate epimerase
MQPFVKVEAGGNDFVLVDGRGAPPSCEAELARDVCRRRRSIGADGLLVVRGGPSVAHFEPDGARTFCLNGVRAAAAWALGEGLAVERLLTEAGPLAVRATGVAHDARVEVALAWPRLCEARRVTLEDGVAFDGTFVDVGNPQMIIEVTEEQLEHPRLMAWGRQVRWLLAAFPGGTNVGFAARRRDGALLLRTYERGVEDETLSCGTGAVATACALARPGERVRLLTRGGDEQVVTLDADRIRAEGPARVVAHGSLAARCRAA